MEQNNKKTIVWIIVGVVVAAVVIYFAVSDGLPQGPAGVETPEGTVAVTGTSPVAPSGEVIAPSGKPADNTSVPGSENAPQQSAPIAAAEVPAQAIKLSVTAAGFSPSSFSANAGSAVTISMTANDEQTHVFRFDDPSLSAVAIGVGPGQTRVITFNAPKQPGTYSFHCDVPGHAARGETGTMTVR
ncbi:MAG: cupredoxin domain-containing protein [Patescibacteria group bacterium]